MSSAAATSSVRRPTTSNNTPRCTNNTSTFPLPHRPKSMRIMKPKHPPPSQSTPATTAPAIPATNPVTSSCSSSSVGSAVTLTSSLSSNQSLSSFSYDRSRTASVAAATTTATTTTTTTATAIATTPTIIHTVTNPEQFMKLHLPVTEHSSETTLTTTATAPGSSSSSTSTSTSSTTATTTNSCRVRPGIRSSQEFKRYRHGPLPYKAGWLAIREVNRGGGPGAAAAAVLKKSLERYVELAGPHLVFSASPNTAICGKKLQIFGAAITTDSVTPGWRIAIRTHQGQRLTLIAESRAEYEDWLRELSRSATRHINDDYEFVHFTRSSIFGRIAIARDVRSHEAVSVRMTRKEGLDDRFVAQARREAMNLLLFPRHPAIAAVLDFYESPSHEYCVTEPVPPGGSIRELVAGRRPMSERDASYVMQSLFKALAHIHAAKLSHRACTPDAVFLVSSDYAEQGIKLTSFEFALSPNDGPRDIVSMMDIVQHQGLDCTLDTSIAPFLAPEVVNGDIGTQIQDAWSAGIIMHYILVAATPFDGPGKTAETALQVIKAARGMPKFLGIMWDGISPDAKDLCAKLLHADPRKRVSPSQALRHPWFRYN